MATENLKIKEAKAIAKLQDSSLAEKHNVKKTGLIIELGKEVLLKEIPAIQIKATSIEVTSMVDDPTTKTVTVNTNSILGTVVLWDGAAYDAIGEWTNEDVKKRLIELIETKK